eukprot:20193-Hanusia_phi.AAC.1
MEEDSDPEEPELEEPSDSSTSEEAADFDRALYTRFTPGLMKHSICCRLPVRAASSDSDPEEPELEEPSDSS